MDQQGTFDSLWILLSAFLVFFMHAGFALVESGFCRKKNAVMVLLKNVGVVSLASIVYYIVGYGVMFDEGNSFMGTGTFAPDGSGMVGTVPTYIFLVFQLMFAATACTIVSGAVAERAKLGPFMIFTAIATAFIYPVVGHWVWGGGLLSTGGFHDFAGSTVVHAAGGGMALAGVLAIGPRIGKYSENGEVRPMPAHNFPMAALGVLILWLGWFGFNGGSTLAADPGAIGPVILSTNLAAAAGFIGALVHVKIRTGMFDLSMALNGALAGLVGITAGADVIGPFSAIAVGIIAGIIVVEGVFLLDKLKIDDPVGAITVHGICGLFGTIAVGLFANTADLQGLIFGGGFGPLIDQLIGALAGFGFAFAAGAVVWFALKAMPGGVRVSKEDELEGLDTSECGVEAYGEEIQGLGYPGEAAGAPAAAAVMAESN